MLVYSFDWWNYKFNFIIEADIDECASGPCRNGGSCLDGVASYVCDCTVGFYGTHCEGIVYEINKIDLNSKISWLHKCVNLCTHDFV